MKLQLPWIGRASGTSAGMIYQSYHGMTVMRAKPVIYHYPNTKPQQTAQAKYWTIMEQWLAIYRSTRKLFPKVMPSNYNIFNVWGRGIYQAALTYPRVFRNKPPRFFGNDRRETIRLSFPVADYDLEDAVLKLAFGVDIQYRHRTITPELLHCILINQTRQSLQYAVTKYEPSNFDLVFEDLEGWQPSDGITVYVAIQDQEFFTNFFRVLP